MQGGGCEGCELCAAVRRDNAFAVHMGGLGRWGSACSLGSMHINDSI